MALPKGKKDKKNFMPLYKKDLGLWRHHSINCDSY
jgi:hypothetical protein